MPTRDLEFSELLRQARKTKGWTQRDLVEFIQMHRPEAGDALTQPQLSDLERGHYRVFDLPSKDPERRESGETRERGILGLLASALDISVENMKESLEADRRLLEGDAAAEIFGQQRRFIREIGGPENLEIWFFGAETLPVLTNQDVIEEWQTNLAAGASYCLIWVLDTTMPGVITEVTDRLKRIWPRDVLRPSSQEESEPVNGIPKSGCINHYSVEIRNESPFVAVNRDEYQFINTENPDGHVVHPIYSDSLAPRFTLYYSSIGSVIFLRRRRGDARLAIATLRGVKTRVDERESDAFFLLPERPHFFEINRLVAELGRSHPSKKNNQ